MGGGYPFMYGPPGFPMLGQYPPVALQPPAVAPAPANPPTADFPELLGKLMMGNQMQGKAGSPGAPQFRIILEQGGKTNTIGKGQRQRHRGRNNKTKEKSKGQAAQRPAAKQKNTFTPNRGAGRKNQRSVQNKRHNKQSSQVGQKQVNYQAPKSAVADKNPAVGSYMLQGNLLLKVAKVQTQDPSGFKGKCRLCGRNGHKASQCQSCSSCRQMHAEEDCPYQAGSADLASAQAGMKFIRPGGTHAQQSMLKTPVGSREAPAQTRPHADDMDKDDDDEDPEGSPAELRAIIKQLRQSSKQGASAASGVSASAALKMTHTKSFPPLLDPIGLDAIDLRAEDSGSEVGEYLDQAADSSVVCPSWKDNSCAYDTARVLGAACLGLPVNVRARHAIAAMDKAAKAVKKQAPGSVASGLLAHALELVTAASGGERAPEAGNVAMEALAPIRAGMCEVPVWDSTTVGDVQRIAGMAHITGGGNAKTRFSGKPGEFCAINTAHNFLFVPVGAAGRHRLTAESGVPHEVFAPRDGDVEHSTAALTLLETLGDYSQHAAVKTSHTYWCTKCGVRSGCRLDPVLDVDVSSSHGPQGLQQALSLLLQDTATTGTVSKLVDASCPGCRSTQVVQHVSRKSVAGAAMVAVTISAVGWADRDKAPTLKKGQKASPTSELTDADVGGGAAQGTSEVARRQSVKTVPGFTMFDAATASQQFFLLAGGGVTDGSHCSVTAVITPCAGAKKAYTIVAADGMRDIASARREGRGVPLVAETLKNYPTALRELISICPTLERLTVLYYVPVTKKVYEESIKAVQDARQPSSSSTVPTAEACMFVTVPTLRDIASLPAHLWRAGLSAGSSPAGSTSAGQSGGASHVVAAASLLLPKTAAAKGQRVIKDGTALSGLPAGTGTDPAVASPAGPTAGVKRARSSEAPLAGSARAARGVPPPPSRGSATSKAAAASASRSAAPSKRGRGGRGGSKAATARRK